MLKPLKLMEMPNLGKTMKKMNSDTSNYIYRLNNMSATHLADYEKASYKESMLEIEKTLSHYKDDKNNIEIQLKRRFVTKQFSKALDIARRRKGFKHFKAVLSNPLFREYCSLININRVNKKVRLFLKAAQLKMYGLIYLFVR